MGEVVEPTFRSSVTRLVGPEARAWLLELPRLEAELAERWQLELGAELRGGLLASVRAVLRADGSHAVMKLGGSSDHTANEIACLRRWAGGPAPRLLEADESCDALLLERIEPGTAATAADAGAVVALLRGVQLPGPTDLRPLSAAVGHRLDRAERDGRASEARLAWARAALERLDRDAPAPVIVHGDFDERNLLVCARRGLCAIDPLPCSGDGAYDAAHWVHANRRPGRRARFDGIVAAGDYDPRRLRDWCGVIGVHG